MNNKLQFQFVKLIKFPTMQIYLTQDLYEYMRDRSGFIAHYNRQGFHKARFLTLADFDRTIELMRLDKDLKILVDNIPTDDLSWARYSVASSEASLLKKQAEIYMYHVNQLQDQFTVPLV